MSSDHHAAADANATNVDTATVATDIAIARHAASSTLTHIVSSLPLPNKPTAKKELMKVMEQETWATLSSHEKLRYLVETNLVNKMSPRPIWQRFTYHIRPETISKTAMV